MLQEHRATPRLLPEERRRRILELLGHRQRLTVDELTLECGVSAVTIRHDLEALAKAGLVVRSHGGALLPSQPFRDEPWSLKARIHAEEKRRIGLAAASFVRRGDTISIDAGTTTAQLAAQIVTQRIQPLTVITNSLTIALALSSLPDVHVLMVGGDVRKGAACTVGPLAERALDALSASRLFLGADAIDLDAGLSTPDTVGANVNQSMIKAARDVTVLADATKFGRRAMSRVASLDDVDRIVTDARIDDETVRALRSRDIEVVIG